MIKYKEIDMKIEDANKAINRYMGTSNIIPSNINELSWSQKKLYMPYAHSLDALVPVWEKLNDSYTHGVVFLDMFLKNWEGRMLPVFFTIKMVDGGGQTGNTIQEAACIATAKAIKELNEKSNNNR